MADKPKGKTPKPQRSTPDRERIESEYRAGVLSVPEIARQFGDGITHQAIYKMAKKNGWKRDLTKKVQQRTKQKLVAEVAELQQGVATSNAQPTDDEIIEAAATQQTEVIKIHRKDIRSGRELVALLSSQLKDAASLRESIEELIIADTEPVNKENGKPDLKRRTAMLKAVSLPAHGGVIRDLSTALKNLVALERQAFNIDDKSGDSENAVSKLLDEVAKRAAPLVEG